MTKIPVGQTIAKAFRFTTGNFLTVLGLTWIALAIDAAASYLFLLYYYQSLRQIASCQRAAGLGLTSASATLLVVFTLLFASMTNVACARQALGLRSGVAFYYFSLEGAV